MKLQFSLATLLVGVTVLAVICAVAVAVHVHEILQLAGPYQYGVNPPYQLYKFEFDRAPHIAEIAWRMFVWGTPSVAATLAVLWSIRRLKSRRHTEPPVG